ncbi:MAG TPA: ATP-binding protein [Nitrospiraceae bacterium]|nr:ATP-binding protein [Nitrospiraceae bacterium]
MRDAHRHWWDRLSIQKKVWLILLLLVVPLVGALAGHLLLVNYLLATQQIRHNTILALEQTQGLRRLVGDIENAFHGYLLTGDQTFLASLTVAEQKLGEGLDEGMARLRLVPPVTSDPALIGTRLRQLLASKHSLLSRIERGDMAEVLTQVRSGEGLALSDQLRADLRQWEDELQARLDGLERKALALSTQTYWGLVAVVCLGIGLGIAGVRLLTRSLTEPLGSIRAALSRFGKGEHDAAVAALQSVRAGDEIGQLARSCEAMIGEIRTHLHEIEVIQQIGHEINTIGPDGLEGVLKRITDQTVQLTGADVCLILSRNDRMGCWIIEAASGEWNDRLRKTVLLWEELPVAVRAYESGRAVIGENLRNDTRSEVVCRNVIGNSILAIPLCEAGKPFGVLALLRDKPGTVDWNIRLSTSLAEEAAVAISNAHLYDAAHEKEQRVSARLRTLEHMAEMLAHDLKGPGERMGELAAVLRRTRRGQLDAQTEKWLRLIEDNSQELSARIESLLALAHVGGRAEAVEAVDPNLVLDHIVKARAGDLEAHRIHLERRNHFPLVAVHRAYLHQVLDNVLSNAIKFVQGVPEPRIVVSSREQGNLVCFTVADNGPGIPDNMREKVFEPFVRLQPASVKGSGIGLTIVRRIVDLYGGSVWIEEASGGGCQVKLTLPLLGAVSASIPSGEAAVARSAPSLGGPL